MRLSLRIAYSGALTLALLGFTPVMRADEYDDYDYGYDYEDYSYENDYSYDDGYSYDDSDSYDSYDYSGESYDSGSQELTVEEAEPAPAPRAPAGPRTVTITYDPNGGVGTMDPNLFTEGQGAPLARCTFTRSGYTFEGWTTEADGGGQHFVDGTDIAANLDFAKDALTLYAQWGSQIYLIRYANGVPEASKSPAEGTMPTQFAVHDAEVALLGCGFTRKGYTAQGWMDPTGVFRDFGSIGTNFAEGTSTTSWEVATLGVDLARGEEAGNYKWSCQGSVVFEGDDGVPWAAVAFINYDDNYRVGSLDTYDSEIIVCDLQTGELKKHASGLMLEHANDIAYNPDNGHFYVAQGGLHDGLPDGIVELDENLKEVRTVTPEGTHHIWNITYSDGTFYAIGNVDGDSFARGNPTGDTSDLIRLDQDLNVLDMHAIDFSSQGFSGQGMACDGDELYAILVNFAEADAANKQRLSLFTLEGEARGTQYIDIPHEVESASWLDGRMYFSINGGASSTLYRTDLASTTMTCVWKPNVYHVSFDANGLSCTSFPEPLDVEYDRPFPLPEETPESPGYEFAGWSTSPDGSGETYKPGEEVSNLIESGTVTLYAQWARPKGLALVADNGSQVRGRRFRPNARERLAQERIQAQREAAGPGRSLSVPAADMHIEPVPSWALFVVLIAAYAARPARRHPFLPALLRLGTAAPLEA